MMHFLAFPLARKLRSMTTKLVTLRDFIHIIIMYCNVTRYHKYKCPGDHYETVSPMILDKGWGVGLLFHFIWVFSGI